jgi:hypothetical protein
MLRTLIVKPHPATPDTTTGEIDIATIATVATVQATSETPKHPIDHAFDEHRGSGGTRWIAGELGEQTVILAFDAPQRIKQIFLEVEELEVARTQELQLCLSYDGGRTYRELLRQEFNFSPAGTTFEREKWLVSAEGVTDLRLVIKPDKGDKPCRATLTSFVVC